MDRVPERQDNQTRLEQPLRRTPPPFPVCSQLMAGAGSGMSVDSVFRTRSLGVAAEGLPDQYADGKAAKVWQLYIGDTQSRTREYKSWVVSLLKHNGVRRVLDVACGTG